MDPPIISGSKPDAVISVDVNSIPASRVLAYGLDLLDSVDSPNIIDSLRRSDGVCNHGWMPVDRTPELPSRRVEVALRARIDGGEWESQERLPSVATLAGEYGVARATVVAALRRIEADGLVMIVSNWGTFRT
jgi:hypothetical protein